MKKAIKISFLPLIMVSLLFLLNKVDFFPYFFQKVEIPQMMYHLFYPSVKSFSGFDAIGFAYIFLGLVFSSIFLILGMFIKDKYIKIGSFIVIGWGICMFVFGIYLQFFVVKDIYW